MAVAMRFCGCLWLAACLRQILLASAKTTPGFQFLGYGYDALFGNPHSTAGDADPGFRTNIFVFTNNDGQKTADGKWDVPDKTTALDLGEDCSEQQDLKIQYSAYDYQHSVDNGVSLSGGFFNLEFSLSADTKNVEAQTRNDTKVYAQVQAQCAAYQLTMHTYDHPPLDANFIAGVKYLPVNYSESEYMEFLKNFGTHVVTQLSLGGRWGWQMSFEYMSYKNMLTDDVDIDIGIKYAGQARAGIDFHHDEHMSDYMQVINSISSNTTFNVGGEFNPDMNAWMESVRASPMPTHLTLTRIDKLLSPMYITDIDEDLLKAKAAAMSQAFEEYCPFVKNTLDPTASCKPFEPKPPPEPYPLAANAVRRICVDNEGGYSMNFELHDLTTQYPVTAQTGNYARGQTDCLDGNQIGAARGDTINCRENRQAGMSLDCNSPGITYDVRSQRQANFRSSGSTFTGGTDFTGYGSYRATDAADFVI